MCIRDRGYSTYDGGDGIHSDGDLTIPGTASIGSAIGGSGGSDIVSSGAGNGIYSGGKLTISGGTIGTVQGGNATADHKDGGSGIYSKGDLSIEGGTIGTAQGGSGRSGGYGIRSNQELTIEGGEDVYKRQLLHRPDVLEARPPSAGFGRRDPRQ